MRNITAVDCSQDTDMDQQPECILSNHNYFAVIDQQGGRLALLFARTSESTIQLVSPSSQFIVGLSDSRSWNLSAGSLADPLNIPGAFADPWTEYQVEPIENGIRLTALGVEKIFQLSEAGLQVEIHSDQPQRYHIPLAVAPETRFTPGWMDRYQELDNQLGYVWGIKAGPKVVISSLEELSISKSQDSQHFLRKPENPNIGYPSGYFIPFPMAIVDINPQNNIWIEIKLSE